MRFLHIAGCEIKEKEMKQNLKFWLLRANESKESLSQNLLHKIFVTYLCTLVLIADVS